MQLTNLLVAPAMVLAFFMSTGSYVEAQVITSHKDENHASRLTIGAAMQRTKSVVRSAPMWNKKLNQETVNRYGLQVRDAIGYTMGNLLTTRNFPITSSIMSREGNQSSDCIACHGISQFDGNKVTLWGNSRMSFCNKVPGFLSNPGKPEPIKNMLRDWYSLGCQGGDEAG